MGTYDYTPGSKSENAKMMAYGETHAAFVLKRKVTGVNLLASDATLTSNAKISSGDVIKLISVPKLTYIRSGGVTMYAAWSCTSLDWGYGTDDDCVFTAYDIATGSASATATSPAVKTTAITDAIGGSTAEGVVLTSADTFDLTFGADETYVTTSNNCSGVFWLTCFDVSDISLDEYLD